MLLAEGLNELLVHGLVAVVSEDTEQGLAVVKSLGRLVKATGEAVVDKSCLRDLLDGGDDIHGAGVSRGSCGRSVNGHGFISFNIRHGDRLVKSSMNNESEKAAKIRVYFKPERP